MKEGTLKEKANASGTTKASLLTKERRREEKVMSSNQL